MIPISFRVYSGNSENGPLSAAHSCALRNIAVSVSAGHWPNGLIGMAPPAGFEPAHTAPEAACS